MKLPQHLDRVDQFNLEASAKGILSLANGLLSIWNVENDRQIFDERKQALADLIEKMIRAMRDDLFEGDELCKGRSPFFRVGFEKSQQILNIWQLNQWEEEAGSELLGLVNFLEDRK